MPATMRKGMNKGMGRGEGPSQNVNSRPSKLQYPRQVQRRPQGRQLPS